MKSHYVDSIEKRRALMAGFVDRGETISDWARAHQFDPKKVYALLQGRSVGRRGQAHEIAVALGLKGPARSLVPPGPLEEVPDGG